MHRTDVKDDSGNDWYVFHNGDWSGMAMIRRTDWGDDKQDIIVPGFVVKNACRQAVIQEVQSKLEGFLDGLL